MTNQIKAVFFDLDGTLRIPNPGPTDAFVHFARSLNIEIPLVVEKRVKIWAHRYWGQDDLVKYDMERFDSDEFWINYSKLLLETVDVSHDLMKRAKLIREWFDKEYKPEVELADGCHEMLVNLKKAGCILGVISNRPSPLHSELSSLGLEGCFEIALAAGEVGCWKPNPLIFQHAVARFDNLQAEECLYVGDNYYADGHGAEEAGLIPVLFDPDNLYEKSNYWRIQHMSDLPKIVLNKKGRNGARKIQRKTTKQLIGRI